MFYTLFRIKIQTQIVLFITTTDINANYYDDGNNNNNNAEKNKNVALTFFVSDLNFLTLA